MTGSLVSGVGGAIVGGVGGATGPATGACGVGGTGSPMVTAATPAHPRRHQRAARTGSAGSKCDVSNPSTLSSWLAQSRSTSTSEPTISGRVPRGALCVDCLTRRVGRPATDPCGLCQECARHPPCGLCGSAEVADHGFCSRCGATTPPAWPGTPCAFCGIRVGITGICALCDPPPLWKHFRAAELRASRDQEARTDEGGG